VNCDSQCAGATNRDECKASCESTCAHDCKVKCDELPVDARCVEHCNQCCLGSCTAQANFDCQIDCQAPDFSACRQRLADACSAGCTGAGALFCDGQFVVAGDAIQQCLAALQEMGVEAHVEFKASARTGCSTGAAGGAGAALVMVLLGLLWRRRR
jgi:MYXO-CTERM domain-containing protein